MLFLCLFYTKDSLCLSLENQHKVILLAMETVQEEYEGVKHILIKLNMNIKIKNTSLNR